MKKQKYRFYRRFLDYELIKTIRVPYVGGDQEVENDAIVYVVYRLGEGETWEIVQVSTGAEADEGKVEDKK